MKKIGFITIILIGLLSCEHDRNHPGYAYKPDMVEPVPAEAYNKSEAFNNGRTLQKSVEGTVPREQIPYTIEDKEIAGEKLKNPLTFKTKYLVRGKEQYQIFCTICHGDKGKGDGYLIENNLYSVDPMDLSSDYVQDQPDGSIYHTITKGSTVMGAHGSLISPEDRWKVVLYIKNGFKTD